MIIIISVLGILIGSFLNVCIYRIPEKQSINWPRSHCMACGHVLGPLELIPIMSYLVLGRRCKVCKTPIGARYMGVELFTGIGFGMIYSQSGLTLVTLQALVLFCFAVVLSLIDWDHMILPTVIIRWGIAFGIVLKGYESWVSQTASPLIGGLVGGVMGYLLFMGLYYGSEKLLKKEALGYGDVRLMGMLGLYLGANSVFIMLIISGALALVYGLIVLMVKRKSEPLPFGPFLNGGAMVTLLWGESLGGWYMDLIYRLLPC